MSIVISGLGALAASANLKLRALTTIVWNAPSSPIRNRDVKRRGGKIATVAYEDTNEWTRTGYIIDPTNGRRVNFTETFNGVENPNNGSHTFTVNFPAVITDSGGAETDKMVTVTITCRFQKHNELKGEHLRDVVNQAVSYYAGTPVSNDIGSTQFDSVRQGGIKQ